MSRPTAGRKLLAETHGCTREDPVLDRGAGYIDRPADRAGSVLRVTRQLAGPRPAAPAAAQERLTSGLSRRRKRAKTTIRWAALCKGWQALRMSWSKPTLRFTQRALASTILVL